MIDFIFRNQKIFFHFVDQFNERYRSGHDLSLYKDIIRKHEEYHNDLQALLKDDRIYPLIMKTLKAWNMDQYNGPQNLDSEISYTWEIKGGGPSGTNAKEVSAFI